MTATTQGIANHQDFAPDGPPAVLHNAGGRGPFVLVCEHASNHVPSALGALGLPPALLDAHIAWDPGALALAGLMSQRLDAPLLAGRYSRLIYDCNRPPEAPDAMPARSEVHDIPGNSAIGPAERAARAAAIYHPFAASLSAAIDAQVAAIGTPAIVTVHSYTPVWRGSPRAVQLGILHDADSRLADALLAAAHQQSCGLNVQRNQPYGPEDGVTHTLREHALPRKLPNVMIEVRNDLLATEADTARIAELLSDWLVQAMALLAAAPPYDSAPHDTGLHDDGDTPCPAC